MLILKNTRTNTFLVEVMKVSNIVAALNKCLGLVLIPVRVEKYFGWAEVHKLTTLQDALLHI